MTELQEVYTLDEMLKLYALYSMQLDIEERESRRTGKEVLISDG